MIPWQTLIAQVDPKDIEEYGLFRESSVLDKDHYLGGLVISKKTQKSYNIMCQLDTVKFEENSKVRVFCNCDDFAFRRAYVLAKQDALLRPHDFILTPPKKTNPNEILSVCKHIKVFLLLKYQKKLKTISQIKDSI